jgi:hypothetical protein
MIGAALNSEMKLSCMPAKAPATVGSIDSASSQYVLRRTRLLSTAVAATGGGSDDVVPVVNTGSNLRSMVAFSWDKNSRSEADR